MSEVVNKFMILAVDDVSCWNFSGTHKILDVIY